MSGDDAALRRVRFFGVKDLAVGMFVDQAAEVAERFDPSDVPTGIADVIELYNVQQYLENGFFPAAYSDAQRKRARARGSEIRSAVARYFSSIDDSNCGTLIDDVFFGYHGQLLELLGRNRAFERCAAEVMLPALDRAGVHLREMLTSKKLVEAYDTAIRNRLRADAQHAEFLVGKYMQRDAREEVHLPTSLTPADARQLLEGYVDRADANPNYVDLIATARISAASGVDAKLKLRAKRRSDEMTRNFFDENTGFRTGCQVGLSDTQEEPVSYEVDESDGWVTRFTYSTRWLEHSCDYPSILNNFQHLFEFADWQVLLTLPSYSANLGVFERFMKTVGKTDYQTGAAFKAVDISTLLQTRLYHYYLGTKNIDLEEVVSWFFREYLLDEFGAANLSFAPSDTGSPYLQRVRHLFAEMESVLTQFSLFVENGELDRELLAISADQVRYRQVPSLMPGKYIYQGGGDEIAGILHVLFSDQSPVTYINEGLKADTAAQLLLNNHVAYSDLDDYQKPVIDHLIRLGVLLDTGTRVGIANAERLLILKSLFNNEAVSFYHLSESGRAEADLMVSKGWVTRGTSLLTQAESKYFNFYLNKVEFSNGPELRNKYLHGLQVNAEGEDRHFHTYITALRLMLALVIKLNDDFCLAAEHKPASPSPSA